jgi:hypothetical protein
MATADKAMLVRLKNRSWTASKPMKEEGREVENRNQGKSGTASVWVKLMRCDQLDKYNANYRAAKNVWEKYTMPWLDGGLRILPSELFFEFRQEIAPYLEKAETIVREFEKVYEDERDFMLNRNSPMYQPQDYPSLDEIGSKFSLTVGYFPVPNATDWRVDVSEEEAKEIKAETEKQVLEAQHDAVKDVARRLAKNIEHMHERLHGNKTFRDSMVKNMRDQLDLIPKLNFVGDQELEDLRKEAEASLLRYGAQQLRDDKVARNTTAKEADELVKKLNKYMNSPDSDGVSEAA